MMGELLRWLSGCRGATLQTVSINGTTQLVGVNSRRIAMLVGTVAANATVTISPDAMGTALDGFALNESGSGTLLPPLFLHYFNVGDAITRAWNMRSTAAVRVFVVEVMAPEF